jgi:hypothetical protein
MGGRHALRDLPSGWYLSCMSQRVEDPIARALVSFSAWYATWERTVRLRKWSLAALSGNCAIVPRRR